MSRINARRAALTQGQVAPDAGRWQMASLGQVVALEKPPADMDQVLNPERVGGRTGGLRAGQPEALAVDSIVRTYGRIVALDGVSLSIATGELAAIVGYSGSGKSTLLRLIAGLEQPDAGTIAVSGRVVSAPGIFVQPEERGVGMMFQDYALFPHLSVLKNVMFGLRRLNADTARATARRALERVGLANREADYPHALSGGEQQRVALARALVPEPKILLMDEPFSNLDRRTRDLVREETAAVLRESGATAILVTHDHDDAMRLADRVILIQSGKVIQNGSPEDLYQRPISLGVARFFSELNEIGGVCRAGTVDTVLGVFAAIGIAEGAATTVCIRRSDIVLGRPGEKGAAGRIVARSFLGDAQLLGVAVASLPADVQVLVPPDTVVEMGGEVAVSVRGGRAFVFPAA